MSTELNKLSENVYPKGNIEELVEKLQSSVLDPIIEVRQRGFSAHEK